MVFNTAQSRQYSVREVQINLGDDANAEIYLFSLLTLAATVWLYSVTIRVKHCARIFAAVGIISLRRQPYTIVSWIKIRLLFAPLLGRRAAAPIVLAKRINLGCLPIRLHAVIIGLVFGLNVLACVWNVSWFAGRAAILSVLFNRSGRLAIINLIPIALMSSIRNPLINVLQVDYATFLLMHRWFGRFSIAQGLCHSLLYLAPKVHTQGWALLMSHSCSETICFGLLALAAGVIVTLQAWKPIRAASYEFFLHAHIMLATLMFSCLWVHLRKSEFLRHLHIAGLLWLVLRVLRHVSLLYRSFGNGGCEVTVRIVADNAMAVDLYIPRPWTARPGRTLYLSVPTVGWWTSHPFSVAWNNVDIRATKAVLQKNNCPHGKSTAVSYSEELETNSSDGGNISLIIKKQNGFTKDLYNHVLKSGKTVVRLRAMIEGPYGLSRYFAGYSSVMLFAGGVGITHQLPYVNSLVESQSNLTTSTTRITLVWVMRDVACVEWVRPWLLEITKSNRHSNSLQLLLYSTTDLKGFEIESLKDLVKVEQGRPDCLDIVMTEAHHHKDRLAVSVCAGGSLADEVRKISRYAVSQGLNLDFFQEGYGW